jgi:hypothetical protein
MKINIKKDGFDFSLGLGDVLVADNGAMYMLIEDSSGEIGLLSLEDNVVEKCFDSLDTLRKTIAKGMSIQMYDDSVRYIKEIIKSKDLVLDIQRDNK